MTTVAIVRIPELRKLAKIAKEEDVDCWVERAGYRFGVSPKKAGKKDIVDSDSEITL